MRELVSKESLLDEALTRAVGPVDGFVADAIVGICNDAADQVLGPAVVQAIEDDPSRLPLVAPWVWDLARGLHFQGREGWSQTATGELTTVELLSLLSPGLHDPQQIQRFAETIDLATALTLDRLLEAVVGPGACARPLDSIEVAVPWLVPLKLGYRIHIALELLRLTPSG